MITAFMASVVKTAAFGAFYRLFSICFADIMGNWVFILSVIIILTILVGNTLASGQTNVKRMLAYSGVSQAGYMLMTLLILNVESANALFFYAGSYALSTISAFAVLYLVSREKGDESFEAFNSLGKTHPVLAIVMAVSMLSLAGIPPAVGFFAKFFLFETVLSQGYTFLVIIAILGSLISVYYYFKIIIAMYGKEAETAPIKISPIFQAVLIVVMCLIVILGVIPNIFIEVLR
jgi:NADH-quinone oxidoreductase subunit N